MFFFKIRLLFWPEISALGAFLNFENERVYPPKYVSAHPGVLCYETGLVRPLRNGWTLV